MTSYVYVDNSNLYIEGCRLAAVQNGFEETIHEALRNQTVDHDWQMDYGRLHQLLCGPNSVARLWGSPPPGDSFWDMVNRKGWKAHVYDRSAFNNKEKKVDVAIAYAMTKDAYTVLNKATDDLTLVAGDKDYEPMVSDLVAQGFKVDVAFWSHAAGELKRAASNFVNLDEHHKLVTHAGLLGPLERA